MTRQRSKLAALKSVSVALSVLIATAASEAGGNDAGRSERSTPKTLADKASGGIGDQLTVDSRLRDLLAHPAFAGFGQLLLPWDNRSYDPNMPLNIESREKGGCQQIANQVKGLLTGFEHLDTSVIQ